MARVHVCSLPLVDETVQATGARTLVTLMTAGTPMTRPPVIPAERHLVVSIADIVEATEGHVLAAADHVDEFLAFVRAWDRAAPLLIHCFAGVSRSTAAAFVTVCTLDPTRGEQDIATALRAASPTATPNARFVALADAALGRDGRMIAAVHAIGRGAECREGVPFWLDVP